MTFPREPAQRANATCAVLFSSAAMVFDKVPNSERFLLKNTSLIVLGTAEVHMKA